MLARKMNSGMAPSRVHLLKATMALNAEAAARGPVPTRRMKAEAVIRFQEEIDDPLYEIIDEDIPGENVGIRSARGPILPRSKPKTVTWQPRW